MRIPIQPLTAAAFAPFGTVTDMRSTERRVPVAQAFDRTPEAVDERLWITTFTHAATLPLRLSAMERHPHSAQTVLPVDGARYLAVVCLADAHGAPDLTTLQAFEGGPDLGLTYARNVWHHGLAVLTAPARFVVCMSFTAHGGDDVFAPVDVPVECVPVEDRRGVLTRV